MLRWKLWYSVSMLCIFLQSLNCNNDDGDYDYNGEGPNGLEAGGSEAEDSEGDDVDAGASEAESEDAGKSEDGDSVFGLEGSGSGAVDGGTSQTEASGSEAIVTDGSGSGADNLQGSGSGDGGTSHTEASGSEAIVTDGSGSGLDEGSGSGEASINEVCTKPGGCNKPCPKKKLKGGDYDNYYYDNDPEDDCKEELDVVDINLDEILDYASYYDLSVAHRRNEIQVTDYPPTCKERPARGVGDCHYLFIRYYFDMTAKECKRLILKGCDVSQSGNKFLHKYICLKTCTMSKEKYVPKPLPQGNGWVG